MPVLEDGDFRLTESSAILKYLADKIDSPAYPKDLRKRARVNEMMDWLNTGFYRDFGYGLVYPQIFPHHKRRSDEAQAGDRRVGQAEGEVLARRPRPAPARHRPEVPVRRRHHDRRLPRRRHGLARRGHPLRLLALPEPRALVRRDEGAAELGEGERGVLRHGRRAQGQGSSRRSDAGSLRRRRRVASQRIAACRAAGAHARRTTT